MMGTCVVSCEWTASIQGRGRYPYDLSSGGVNCVCPEKRIGAIEKKVGSLHISRKQPMISATDLMSTILISSTYDWPRTHIQ